MGLRALLLLFCALGAHAASLTIAADAASYAPGDTITLTLMLPISESTGCTWDKSDSCGSSPQAPPEAPAGGGGKF